MLSAMGGMFTYWYVLNAYGIPLETSLYLVNKEGYMPLASDVYDPSR